MPYEHAVLNVERKTVVFWRWSVIYMCAVFKRKVWSECMNGEWDWGRDAKIVRLVRGSTLSLLRAFRLFWEKKRAKIKTNKGLFGSLCLM